ncbi:hypothetical protein [Micromonospora sp. CNB394]|uniref:hypothetical protein n=1 Tax=Micromonospora sp. CNB394 TaxID=1169151 RepID=UPI0009DBC71A|nr:hypothetical protein [Micromonospora sp. CNB394]
MDALLRGGPGDGQTVPAGGESLVWRACLYELTGDRHHQRDGRILRIYRHRPDCCEPRDRGSQDRCE